MEATQLLVPVSNHKKRKVMEDAVAVAAPDEGGAAVALEQQVGAEAEAVVEAKLGVIVPGKSITLSQRLRDRSNQRATPKRSVEVPLADLEQELVQLRLREHNPRVSLLHGYPKKWTVDFVFPRRSRFRTERIGAFVTLEGAVPDYDVAERIGAFDTLEEAMFGYDVAEHFLGNPTYFLDYPKGFFEPCPPRLKYTPLTKGFLKFVKEKANQYAKHDPELQLNVLMSEARTLTDWPVEFGFDGAPNDGGAAVALEQQVGAEAEAVVEAKLGVIVPDKSITLNQIQRDGITKIATASRWVEERADMQQALAPPVLRNFDGSPGVHRQRGSLQKWEVEIASSGSCIFDRRVEAMLAYDAAKHFQGERTFYFKYAKGFFEPCPRILGTSVQKGFVAFVKETVKKYSMLDPEDYANKLISEAPTLMNRPLVVAGDGAPAVALEQQVGAEAEAVVEAKLGIIVLGKSITLNQIQRDRITKIATANWSVTRNGNASVAFNAQLVVDIYRTELTVSAPLQRVMVLEISQYLENYLWPHFDPLTATFEHVMSIILMVNEKFRENVPAWACFHEREDVFPLFFNRVLTLKDQEEHAMSIREKTNYLLFMIHCFQSLEDEKVRVAVLKLVSLQLWHALSPGRLQMELVQHSQLLDHWKKLLKKEVRLAKASSGTATRDKLEVRFLPSLVQEFLEVLESTVIFSNEDKEIVDNGSEAMENGAEDTGPSVDPTSLLYCERFAEFLIDLLSQLPTRRFVRALVEDAAVVVKSRMSALYAHPRGHLFSQLIDLLRFYQGYEINDQTGTQLSDDEVLLAHSSRLQALQRLVFKQVPKLRDLALANVGSIERRSDLEKRLKILTPEELKDLVCEKLKLVSSKDPWADRWDFLVEVMVSSFEKRQSQRESINALPLYPNEEVMWDESLVPSINYTGEGCLALPKLNLQFLTLHDYLLRNFNLFRLESTYEIREDVHDVLKRMGARVGDEGETRFSGWARMAIPIQEFKISEVKQPNIGEVKPSAVTAEVAFSIRGLRGAHRSEWDELKEHDVLFLLSITPRLTPLGKEDMAGISVPERYGLQYVRGCEVIEMHDEGGTLMNDFTGRIKREDWKPPSGEIRTAVVALDSAQYQLDVNAIAEKGAEDVYRTFNVLMRRKPKENNFKAILESIRDLMNEDCVVPDWLHDIFLGYGNPAAAQWNNMPDLLEIVDFKDTFLDAQHLRESFPSCDVKFLTPDGDEDMAPKPPFRVTLPKVQKRANLKAKPATNKRKGLEAESNDADTVKEVLVEAYVPSDPGPYPQDQPKQNSVRFTPVQVGAIISGVQPGLTMVVGPPGTGKTDTAVQVLNVLYHNCPTQRTLLITHSNQALNDLFEKIMQRDVPARYLLRLGQGEQELETELDFSRQGRVNAMLARRLELLAEVERLARTLQVPEDAAYTCETAAHFWLLHVLSRWEEFVAACEGVQDNPGIVKEKFPFKEYFTNTPHPLFTGSSYSRDMRSAAGCFRHLKTMFQELEECRAFELLKSTADRANYLMAKQAKIVAMTCTHAALKRRDFLKLGFKYDNLLMEESAQILEIETFIPMLLQRQTDGRARLKRCILIGDHHQLPPVVKNLAFQKYSHMDQSLFTRFVRLGVPYVQLNAQGRARPSISKLYNWRYRELGDLPNVREDQAFNLANAGFAHEYQLIDVPDYEGKGESEPNPYFYQNLGEAEYVVSVFQYMRLLGYPASKISILSTYNGQKHLIRDVIERRCAHHPLFGRPSKVTTVDRFQGQQNDYILLSLVRTRVVGHLRDVRRLVVAMSRARLGVYVFCRRSLFEQCYELQSTFRLLLQRPDKLGVVLGERSHPTQRPVHEVGNAYLVSGLQEMAHIVTDKFNQQAGLI